MNNALSIQRPSLALLGAEHFRVAMELAWHKLGKPDDAAPVCSDGVVAWQTCRHPKRSSLVHDIEVGGSHIGMGWNRDVLAAVADRLGQQPGTWRRYVRGR